MPLDAPIFIVGAPRSGTTLLASMLAGHSRVACGPETQFFNKLSKVRLSEAVHDPHWPEGAVKLVTSVTLADQAVYRLFGHTPKDIYDFLAARKPSVRAVFESLTALYAAKQEKVRWAEKTPNHLLHLATIRQHFPDAQIIRIVRDPRDSALSMQKLPWASRSVIANGYLWTAWFRESQPFFECDPNTLTVRYEDLVADPNAVLGAICAFIGENFEVGMLESHQYGSRVASPEETWKALNTKRLNRSRIGLWQRELDAATQRALGYICQAGIEAFGYSHSQNPEHTLVGFPLTLSSAESYEATLLRASNRGLHIVASKRPGRERYLLLFPILAGSPKQQLKTAFHLLSVLIARRVRGLKTHHLPPEKPRAGWVQRLLLLLTQTLATPHEVVSVHRKSKVFPRAPVRTRHGRPNVSKPARLVERSLQSPQQKGPHFEV